jgi:oxygen-dependent protoporphyrinogen oxidase
VKIAVVGGGIAGLAAAWELRDRAEVIVFEPDHLGGKLRTSTFAGAPIDEGPDAFLTRVPGAVALCDELGLGAELVAPQAGRTLLWWDGKLREIPGGLVLGVPRDLRPIVTSGLLSPLGSARAALDLVLPRRRVGDDATIDDLVGGRFGRQVAQRLVEPLLGSITAARTSELSAAASAPQLLAAATRSRSLLLALRAAASEAPDGPVFLAPKGGLSRLVDTLVSHLVSAGVTFRSSAVSLVKPSGGGLVDLEGEQFDGAVLAVPARAAAALLGGLAPAGLAGVPITDVVLVTVDVAASELPVPGDVNGILVPPTAGTLMTACSFGSNKWPHWAVRSDRAVIRVSAGRHGDERPAQLDDDSLVNRLVDELGAALRRRLTPGEVRVSRWPGAFPLYRVGHLVRVAAMETDLARSLPSVALAGSSYRGTGIPACITSGRSAAVTLLHRLSSRPAVTVAPRPPQRT